MDGAEAGVDLAPKRCDLEKLTWLDDSKKYL